MDMSYTPKVSGFGMSKVRDYSSRLTGQQRILSASRHLVLDVRDG
jgi:hypothetical protein